ncbi:MAG: methyltransferase domain-containing protein [Acidobacteria bacterium]|nr:methyltransferase domain-containing protein [Acidobacteriota bacterium]
MSLETHLEDQLSDRYERFFWHRLRWRAVARSVPSTGPVSVLDLGAGSGVIGRFIRRDRPRASYFFHEPIPQLAAHLETVFGETANAAKAEDYRGMDVVLALDVFEHLEDDAALVRDLHARMRPGARLVCTVPAGPRLWSDWDRQLGHQRRYTRRSLLGLLSATGFSPRRCRHLFPEMVPMALYRKLVIRESPSEFPPVPRWLNALLYATGCLTQSVCRPLPIGTSLLATATRP